MRAIYSRARRRAAAVCLAQNAMRGFRAKRRCAFARHALRHRQRAICATRYACRAPMARAARPCRETRRLPARALLRRRHDAAAAADFGCLMPPFTIFADAAAAPIRHIDAATPPPIISLFISIAAIADCRFLSPLRLILLPMLSAPLLPLPPFSLADCRQLCRHADAAAAADAMIRRAYFELRRFSPLSPFSCAAAIFHAAADITPAAAIDAPCRRYFAITLTLYYAAMLLFILLPLR